MSTVRVGEKISTIKKGFNGGLWAFRLVFLVVLAELAIVAGSVVGCFAEDICTDADTQATVSYTHLTLPTILRV